MDQKPPSRRPRPSGPHQGQRPRNGGGDRPSHGGGGERRGSDQDGGMPARGLSYSQGQGQARRPRPDGQRSDGYRGDGQRSEGYRGERQRFEGYRGDGQRSEGYRGEGRRQDGPRRNDGPQRFRDNNSRPDMRFRDDRVHDERMRQHEEGRRRTRDGDGNGNGGQQRPRRDDRRPRAPSLALADMPQDNANERKIYGINACLAVARHRPQDVIRGYFTEQTARSHFGEVMKMLAAERRAYHLVQNDDLQRITDSGHHEGVCLLIRDAATQTFDEWIEEHGETNEPQCLIALEDVGNPHNIGAILRICGHFGATALIVKDAAAARSGAALRTAEGAGEAVPVLEADDFDRLFNQCRKAGFTLVSTSSHQGKSLFEAGLPARCLIVLGEERQGLSARRLQASDNIVSIPGTGRVESLNVSIASGVLLAEYWRHWKR